MNCRPFCDFLSHLSSDHLTYHSMTHTMPQLLCAMNSFNNQAIRTLSSLHVLCTLLQMFFFHIILWLTLPHHRLNVTFSECHHLNLNVTSSEKISLTSQFKGAKHTHPIINLLYCPVLILSLVTTTYNFLSLSSLPPFILSFLSFSI